MIQIKYTSLFEVEFLHDYYSEKSCNDIMIVPSGQCNVLLQQLGLRFISTAAGCKVFAKADEKNGKDFIKTPLPENCIFRFLLILKNKSFATYTLLDLKADKNKHYYFNNLVNNKEGDTLHLVTDTTEKKTSSKDLLRFEKGNYQFTAPGNISEKNIQLVLSDTSEMLQQVLDKENDISRRIFSFDLGKVSTGRAELKNNNLTEDSFYAASHTDRQDIFGVVEVFYRQGIIASYQFLEKDNATGNFIVKTKKYTIRFANRLSTWRFNVSRKFNKNITSVNIKKENGTAIDFETAPGSSQDLFIMISKIPVPFTDLSSTKCRFVIVSDLIFLL